jgi:hypothetical protein
VVKEADWLPVGVPGKWYSRTLSIQNVCHLLLYQIA